MTEPVFEAPGQSPPRTEVASSRRGRPRAQSTLARDEQVVKALADGAVKTRVELADELGDKPSLVYLALWRLAHQGKVERVSEGETRHGWRLVS